MRKSLAYLFVSPPEIKSKYSCIAPLLIEKQTLKIAKDSLGGTVKSFLNAKRNLLLRKFNRYFRNPFWLLLYNLV